MGNPVCKEVAQCDCDDGFDDASRCSKCSSNVIGYPDCDKCSRHFDPNSYPSCNIGVCTEFGTLKGNVCKCVKGWHGERCECFGRVSGENVVCTKCSSTDIPYVLEDGQCKRPTTTTTTTTATTITDGNHPSHIRFPLKSPKADGASFSDVRLIPAEIATGLSQALTAFIVKEFGTSAARVQLLLLNSGLGAERNNQRRSQRATTESSMFVDVTARTPQDQSDTFIHLALAWKKSEAGKASGFELGTVDDRTLARPSNEGCGATFPRDSCTSVGGSYQQMKCDGDAVQDHVCVGATFASVTFGNDTCTERVTRRPTLLYTRGMCDVQQESFDSSVILSRQYTIVDIDQQCPSEYAKIGSCEFCNTAAAAVNGGTLNTCSTDTSAGPPISPACVIDDTKATFHADFNSTNQLPGANLKEICAGTAFGCKMSDVRLNVDNCDARTGLDAYIGVVVVVASGAVMTVAFGTRWYLTKDVLHLPILLEATTFVCTLDLITDITYIATETFATPTLYGFAILFILLPFVVPSVYFLGKGYQIITFENLQWSVTARAN